jgi:hypothetical protein
MYKTTIKRTNCLNLQALGGCFTVKNTGKLMMIALPETQYPMVNRACMLFFQPLSCGGAHVSEMRGTIFQNRAFLLPPLSLSLHFWGLPRRRRRRERERRKEPKGFLRSVLFPPRIIWKKNDAGSFVRSA